MLVSPSIGPFTALISLLDAIAPAAEQQRLHGAATALVWPRKKRQGSLLSFWAMAVCTALLLLGWPAGAHAQTATGTVTVGSGPNTVAVDPVTNKMYVTNENDGTVTVIDGATNKTTTVTVGSTPVGAAVNTLTNKIYIANAGSSNVTVIDGATNATTTVPTGANPDSTAINPVTNKIYVSNQVDGTVTVIDGATNATTTLTVGAAPLPAVVNPVTNKIYVGNNHGATVSVIDGATNAITTLQVGAGPDCAAIDLATNKVYFSNFNDSTVSVIDGASNTVTATINVGTNPLFITFNAVTNKIYTGNNGSNNVTVIDGATNATATVALPSAPGGMALNPRSNTIFVTNPSTNNVTVIDGATNATTTLTVGTGPGGVAVNPVTNKIYVANATSNNVTVVDGATNTPTTVSAGTSPSGVAVNPATNKIYVANSGSGNVTVIDGVTSATTTVTVGASPKVVAVNPVTNKIYVVGSTLTVIDGATNATTNVPCNCNSGSVEAIAVNSVTNKIYLAVSSNGSGLTVIDGATNVTSLVPVDQSFAVAVNQVTNKIYLANFNNNLVTVVDGATSAVSTVPAGTNPTAVAVNSVTNKIYVANNGSNNLTVIDGATNAPTTVTDPNGLAPLAVAVNSTTNKIYVLNNGNDGITPGSVTVVDGATNSTTNVNVGLIGVTALALNPVTNKIYVANSVASFVGPSNVKAIDGPTNTTQTILGSGAVSLAVNPVTNAVFAPGSVVTVIAEQPVQVIPLTTTITPLAGDATTSPTPTFTFSAASTFAPTAPPVLGVFFQIDTWQGPWIAAAPKPGGGFNGTAPTLSLGNHILYAFATDGQDSTSVMTTIFGGCTPLTGAIAVYSFAVNTAGGSGTATHFTVSAQATATAGTAFDITVTALDASNVTAAGYTGTVHFTSSDGAATLPANATLTNGVGTFPVTLETAGNQTVTATDTVTSTITGTSSNITVTQPAQFALQIKMPGTAFGNVTDNLGKINCTQTGATNLSGNCIGQYNTGTQVILTASTPGTFAGFSGTPINCVGTGPTCALTLTQNDVVSATFNPGTATFPVTVQAGTPHTGGGLVVSSAGTIACTLSGTATSGTCVQNFPAGTIVTMFSGASPGSQFFGWTGTAPTCLGSSAISCVVAITAPQTISAQFTTGGGTVNVAVTGAGNVKDMTNPAAVNCTNTATGPQSGNCSVGYGLDSGITLTETPANGATFTTWGTSCPIPTATTCTFTLANATPVGVAATFTSSGGSGPAFSSTTLPAGAMSVPYGADIQVTGGTPPYTFALANGSTLPPGFTLVPTASGAISAGHIFSNSPATANTFTFAVKVTDSSPAAPLSATATISLSIGAAPANTQAGLLNGQYALSLLSFEQNGFEDGALGSLTFDGKNTVAGVVDLNNSGGVQQAVAVTGTYSIGPDNRGVITLTNGTANTPLTLAISVGGIDRGLASTARITQFNNTDGNDNIGSGSLRLQDPTAFNQNTFAGTYAFGLTGQGSQMVRVAELGLISFTNTLGVSGSADVNEGGTLGVVSSISGTYIAPDKNGRIVQTTVSGGSSNPSNVAIYQIDANEGIAMTIDPRTDNVLFVGSGLRQTGPFGTSSLAGPDIVSLGGTATNGTSAFIGVLTATTTTPAPSVGITADSNDGGTVNVGEVLSGSYAVANTGRGTFTTATGGTIFYLAQQDRGFMFTTDSSVSFGTITPQVGAPFGASPFNINFYIGQQEALPGTNSEFSGAAVLGTGNAMTITDDESHSGGNLFFGQALGALNYSVDPFGHFVMQSATQGTVSGYAVSPFEIAFLEQNGPASDPSPSTRPHVVLAEAVSTAPGVPSPAAPSVNFPTPVAIGSIALSAPITITNTGLGPLSITGQNTGNSPDFSASGTCLATSPVVIQPNGTCTIIVTFAPTANTVVGTPLVENLLVLTDGGNITISASGTAATAGAVTHFSVSAPATATAGTALNFTVTALTASNATTTYTGTIHFTSTDGNAILPANSTLTNGVGTFSATLNTIGGQTITATDTITASITGTSGTITVSAVAAPQLMVQTLGSGTGTVTGAGINCTSGSANGCTAGVTAGTQVTLTAAAATGSTFTSWNTVCPNITSTTCTFTMPVTSQTVTATFTLNAATLQSIAVMPANPTEPINSTLQFHATGTFSDNSTKDLTSTVLWQSTNTEAATISEGGLATTGSAADETTTISASQNDVTGSTVLTVSNSPITISVTPPPGGSYPPVPPGGQLAIGIVLTSTPGFTGTVTFGCATDSPTITCQPNPASVAITPGGPTQVAIVLNTFCTGNATPLAPSGRGPGEGLGGIGLLLLGMAMGSAVWMYKRNPRWALSFAVLMLIALGGAACSSLPKGPNGATAPGNYTVTFSATANGVTTATAPIHFTVQ